jgi:O-antigen ligase
VNNETTIAKNSLVSGLMALLTLLTIVGVWAGIRYQMDMLWLLPAIALGTYIAVVDFKILFFLLFATIPISTEYTFPNGLSMDLPSEPLIIALMGITFTYVLLNFKKISSDVILHPITLLLLLHLGWTFVTTVTSENFIFSLKFSLAKIWYVTTFYFLAIKLIQTEQDVKNIFKVVAIPLVLAVIIIELRHAEKGFTFDSINSCVGPFFRNHVTYAALTTLFVPFAWYALDWQKKWSFNWLLSAFGLLIIFIGIQFSYTRAAYASLVIAVGMYYVIKFRLTKWAVLGALIFGIVLSLFLVKKNNFLGFAPDYKKTIMHQNFDNLLQATYKFEDISTMERVYRWVAAGHMIADKPYMGFGPGNFYNFYKHYTVSSFQTYVSDNPEKSGIHCYFLMVWVEQGYFGLFIFLLFNFSVLLLGEKVYHEAKTQGVRRVSLIATLCFTIINAILLINDMVETDKAGSFYFLSAALLVMLDLKNKKSAIFASVE